MQPIKHLFPILSEPQNPDVIAEKAKAEQFGQFGDGFKIAYFLSLNPYASVDEFDSACKKMSIRDLECGCNDTAITPMHLAVGNLPLIHYLAAAAPRLINLADTDGLTPIFYAAMCVVDPAHACAAAKALINLGAKVSYMTDHRAERPWGIIEEGESVLSLTAERMNNLKLIQLLIVSGGGIVYKPLSAVGQTKVDAAMQELFERVKPLLEAWKFDALPLMMPKDPMSLIIGSYVHLLIHS